MVRGLGACGHCCRQFRWFFFGEWRAPSPFPERHLLRERPAKRGWSHRHSGGFKHATEPPRTQQRELRNRLGLSLEFLCSKQVTQAGTAKVATWPKAVSRRTVPTQAEVRHKSEGVQAPGCRECWSLSLLMVDHRLFTCVRCGRVNDLLILVTTGECTTELAWWNQTLPSLR